MEESRVLSRDAIKLIAVLAMLLNHMAHVFVPMFSTPWIIMTSIGYVTAVTMCFFMVEGVRYTRSHLKYAVRLLLFGVISQPPFAYCFYGAKTPAQMFLSVSYNMLFTLFLCFLATMVYERVTQRGLRAVLLVALIILSAWCDWPMMAVGFTWAFLRAQELGSWKDADGRVHWLMAYVKAALMFVIFEMISVADYHRIYHLSWGRITAMILGGVAAISCSAVLTLYLYNGKRGKIAPKAAKWFFYIFYPAHLAVLALIHLNRF